MKFDCRISEPVVSVSIITYNNFSCIEACLDGIIAQQTDFPFEVCIGEDGSIDGTREVCQAYAQKYPECIRLFLREQDEPGREDYASQGVYNYIKTTMECRGRYVAFCDGDDVWTDPRKLQKQYAVMQADDRITLVYSGYDKLNEITGYTKTCILPKEDLPQGSGYQNGDLITAIILGHHYIAASTVFTLTALVHEIFETCSEWFKSLPMGDTQTWSELINRGRVHYISEPLARYTISQESTSNSLSALKKFKFVNEAANFGMELVERYGLAAQPFLSFKVKACNRYALLSGNREEIEQLYNSHPSAFSTSETGLLKLSRIPPLRALLSKLFQMRYLYNHKK